MPYALAVKWTARAGEEDAVAAALQRLVEPSRAEPGNLAYEPHRDPGDPRVFFIYEQYVDEEAFQAHAQSAHIQEHGLGDAVPRLEGRERTVYETL
jgi:quinol monooxygenase YgiN